jgi:SulP family sulfate permease
MGFYTNAPRSATVQAAERCVLYLLDRKKLALLEKKAPVLATAFNRYLVNVLSERLVTANKKAQELR